MKPLIIKATEDTPEINLNPDKGIFHFSKLSLPENAVAFYKPVIEWINKYTLNPNKESVFEFNIEYMNTASSKKIFEIIKNICKIKNKAKVKIIWHYDAIDEDMHGLGIRYDSLTDIDFEFEEYRDEEREDEEFKL